MAFGRALLLCFSVNACLKAPTLDVSNAPTPAGLQAGTLEGEQEQGSVHRVVFGLATRCCYLVHYRLLIARTGSSRSVCVEARRAANGRSLEWVSFTLPNAAFK